MTTTAVHTETLRIPVKIRDSKKGVTTRSLVGDFQWTDVLVPTDAGVGAVKWAHQRRTLIQYGLLAATGLTCFYKVEDTRLRAAGLGLLFPGAGLVAVASISSALSFIISTAALPLILFAWFGCGGIAFPIFWWTGSTVLAGLLAGETIFEAAGPLWAAICICGITYVTWKTFLANAEARDKRQKRNEYLVDAVRHNQSSAIEPEPGSREVDERTLRFVQWFIELGLTGKDDWSYHDIIDQFQTSAIRYQLYETVNCLGLYQNVYAPNFHGYLSQAQRGVIEKSLTQKVLGFWKWESILGKFNVNDWDPVKKDNIMVTGYILQAIGIYQSNTGDDRYCKKDCLEFEVTDTAKYRYDTQGVAKAVFRNMDENKYCLYPCEPNWLYTPCNLVGISGIVATDRLLGNSYGQKLKDRFALALEREFSTCDGTILPIRSEHTGFTLPGLAGALSDGNNAILCAAYLPHIAHRNWAFTRAECIKYDDKGKLELLNLTGADNLDPGNYKSGQGAIRAVLAAAAAEFGDKKVLDDLLRQLDEEFFPVIKTRTGALKNKNLSTLAQGGALRGRLGGYQDWTKMIQNGLPEYIHRGPILDSVPFPDILVAKAYSMDGVSLDLVLYNGNQPGTFTIGFKRLQKGKTYSLGPREVVADSDGTAEFQLAVHGRTAVTLVMR